VKPDRSQPSSQTSNFEHKKSAAVPLLPSYISESSWKQKSRRGIPAPGGFSVDSFELCQPERIKRRLVDYGRCGQSLIGLVAGDRLPGQRPEQSIDLTLVIAHLL
jgi:hypothetical protein